jgi:Tfp pilus assembly protein PilF
MVSKNYFLKLSFILIIILSQLASCSSASKKQNAEEADIFFSMGTNALMNRNYTVALTNLLTAVEKAPNRSDIHNNLGMAYYFKKQNQLALKHIQIALKLEPKNTDAKSNLASLHLDMKQYDQAKKYYTEVLGDLTYPKQHITYYNLGKVEYDQKKYPEAKKYFQQSVQENPNTCASQYYLGLIEYKTKNFKNAQNYFKDAYYGVCYSNEFPLYYHGLSFEKNAEYDKAMGRYQELIDRFPRSVLINKAKERIKIVSVLQSESRPSTTFAEQNIEQPTELETNDNNETLLSPEF